ncbi:hypothetical protein L6452_08248 [Arctium lappa]|uniref:Uncharacterized protein n=1 Tax=Arctium lappa TaxID=4217 RepID=A0ACB9DGZ4_ARCLA|nr:hypothetical protein L6452_08248 [Arctium lappa]
MMEMAITKYNQCERSSHAVISTPVTWKLNMCNQQKEDRECRYHVIKQIFQYAMYKQYHSPHKDIWTTTAAFSIEQIDQLVMWW